MSSLPLAHVSRVVAIQHRATLYLSVAGRTSGFDGTLEIVKSDTRIYPPMFSVFEVPGNCGITGECPPDHEVTLGKAFAGHYRNIQVVTADGILHPPVTSVRDPDPAAQAAGSAGPTENGLTASSPDTPLETRVGPGWWAWEDMMPGGPRSLHVVGQIMMPTPGYKLTLTRSEPQGINPTVLLLDLKETPPPGIVAQHLALTKVIFDESPAPRLYSHIHVRGTKTTIPVEIVG